MTETTILDDSAVSEIEARVSNVVLGPRCSHLDPLIRGDIPALCATVKHLRAENQKLIASRRVHELDNHHNALACGYCSGPLKDELTRLAQVEQEREALRTRLLEATETKVEL